MKNIIFLLLILFCFSCKEDYNSHDENNYSVVDSVVVEVPLSEDDLVFDTTSIIQEDIQEKELTFEEAIVTSSLYDLKKFIKNNPNHNESDLLNKRLIDLEVDAIYYDKSTGEMPKSDLVRNTNSRNSTISISNDTSCELVVRYSGSDSKMISIPSRQTRNVNIDSGNYRITASACGYNYYGTESLSGDYTSSYYIETTYR